MKTTDVTILLVDDDEVDVEAIKRSLSSRKIANPLRVAADGLEALEMLRGTNGYTPLRRPLIVMLDINMPRMNGLEFLKTIRADGALKDLVVFVLTTSSDDRDVYAAYDLNVAGYILKANAGDSFMNAIALIEHYWKVVEFRH